MDMQFELGAVVATPAALAELARAGQDAGELLARHARGVWGEVSADDRSANEEALRSGGRLAQRLQTEVGCEGVGDHRGGGG